MNTCLVERLFNQSYKDVQRSGQVEWEMFAVFGELQESRTENEEKFVFCTVISGLALFLEGSRPSKSILDDWLAGHLTRRLW